MYNTTGSGFGLPNPDVLECGPGPRSPLQQSYSGTQKPRTKKCVCEIDCVLHDIRTFQNQKKTKCFANFSVFYNLLVTTFCVFFGLGLPNPDVLECGPGPRTPLQQSDSGTQNQKKPKKSKFMMFYMILVISFRNFWVLDRSRPEQAIRNLLNS
jgi:hypothetical protein